MADIKVQLIDPASSTIRRGPISTDVVLVGTGIKANGATDVDLTLTALGTGLIKLASHTEVAAGKNLTNAAGAGALTWATSGAISLTSSAAALTLTAGAAATWSTAAGALTVQGAEGLNLNSSATNPLKLQFGGTDVLNVTSATALAVQAGATLATTGTGNINLPNNGSARFQIEGSTVSTNVTATNLNTLTAGSASNADALHTHSGIDADEIIASGIVTTGLTVGDVVYHTATANTVANADANVSAIAARFFGVVKTVGASGTVSTDGVVASVNFAGTTLVAGTHQGAPFYISNTAGKATVDVTSTAGEWISEVGIIMEVLTGTTAKVLLQPKAPILY